MNYRENQEFFIQLLERFDVIKYGHFIGTSGKHLDAYVFKDEIIKHPKLYVPICNELAKMIMVNMDYSDVEFITGPAIAGAVFAGLVANLLVKGFVYPEKLQTEMVYRRGYNRAMRGRNLIIVEDVATTGKSILKTTNAIEKNGGTVRGVVLIWNRSNFTINNKDIPVYSIISKELDSWKPEHCPMCLKGIPITDIKA